MVSDKELLIEDIRKDTESDNYNKYGYLRNDDGTFIQVGIRANNVRELTNSFSYQTLVEKLEKNDQIVYAAFINNDLENTADSREDKIGEIRNSELAQKAVETGENYFAEKSYTAADNQLKINEFFVPVEVGGEQVGVLNLAFSMEEISRVSNETAANSEEVSASSEEQSRVTEEIVKSAENLTVMAQNLSAIVEQFKL